MTQPTFTQRSLEEIDDYRDQRRGRVSYPIVKGFMETGYQVAELDVAGLKKRPAALQMLLKSYISTHRLPIKVVARGSRMYLIRLDIDKDGNPIPDWAQKLAEGNRETYGDVEEITEAIVDEQ